MTDLITSALDDLKSPAAKNLSRMKGKQLVTTCTGKAETIIDSVVISWRKRGQLWRWLRCKQAQCRKAHRSNLDAELSILALSCLPLVVLALIHTLHLVHLRSPFDEDKRWHT